MKEVACTHLLNCLTTHSNTLREVTNMARHISGESFEDTKRNDILQLVSSEVSMTMDDIMQEVEEAAAIGGSCITKHLAKRSHKATFSHIIMGLMALFT